MRSCPPRTGRRWRASAAVWLNIWRRCLILVIRVGWRHTLTSLLLVAVAAVLAGARSFTAMGEWAADAPPRVLAALGVRYDPLARRFCPPDEATIRRVLEAVDAPAVEAAVGSWLAARLQAARPPLELGRRRRQAVAVDGRRCAAPGTPAATGRPRTC